MYLSYIDSVKYFRPELQAAQSMQFSSGPISLRTFVYHQVLLGYLDYTRRMGFEQMFIWACPPLQVSKLSHFLLVRERAGKDMHCACWVLADSCLEKDVIGAACRKHAGHVGCFAVLGALRWSPLRVSGSAAVGYSFRMMVDVLH